MLFKSGLWRKCRIAFRCVRIAVWLLVLAALALLLWCNRVGLPDFLKTRLVATLRGHGVELEFSRMRLNLLRGLVAEHVRVGGAEASLAATLTAREVQLQLDWSALVRHRQLELDGLVLRDGRFTLPLSATNALTLTNLQTELRFGVHDTWLLDHFRAGFAGAQISIAGEVAHASEARQWQMFSGRGAGRGTTLAALNDFSDTLRGIQFQGEPRLRLVVSGDARDVHSIQLRLTAAAGDVQTPWFAAHGFRAEAGLTAPADAPTNAAAAGGVWTSLQPFRLTWTLQLDDLRAAQWSGRAITGSGGWSAPTLTVSNFAAGRVRTPWGAARGLRAAAGLTAPDDGPAGAAAARGFWTNLQPFGLAWSLQLDELRAPQWNAEAIACVGTWSAPTLVVSNLAAQSVQTPWGTARGLRAGAGLTASAAAPAGAAAAWGFWTNVQPFGLTWSLQLDALNAPQLNGEAIACAGAWAAPTLTVSNLAARLGGGRLAASARLDVPTRTLTFTNVSNFDPQILSPWLPAETSRQLAQITWTRPPEVEVGGAVRLPPWTEAGKDWPARLAASLELRGSVAVTNAAAAGVALDRAHARFSYADQLLDLPELTVASGRTQLRLGGQVSETTKIFRGRLAGELDADSVRPLLTSSNALHGFGLLTFHKPLALTIEVAGNLRALETLSATGRLALADFAIRGQTLEQVTADVMYSNRLVDFIQPRISRAGGTQQLAADKVTLDLAGERLFIFNGGGRMDPAVVGGAIGPRTAADMAPYEFLEPPIARVRGCIPIKQQDGETVQDDADLWVDIVGTAHFRWRRFETPAISGTVHWWNHNLILTNAVSECYGGEARGWGTFDLRPEIVGTDFSFDVAGTNVDLHRMGLALWSPTNRLEGTLAGTVTVTGANSSDWRSWNGYGQVRMRDGLLWDVPIFAFMSPVLNAVAPGLGNSRAKDAVAQFVITNGVIATDSLLFNSTMMRLQYAGTVDLRQNVNARVTAQLLHNTPVVGTLVSTVLWPVSKIFECRVTGLLDEPVVKPLYIPSLLLKPLLVPLHPIRSLEELFAPATGTNAPATD